MPAKSCQRRPGDAAARIATRRKQTLDRATGPAAVSAARKECFCGRSFSASIHQDRSAVLMPRSLRFRLQCGFVRKLSPGDCQRFEGTRVRPARISTGTDFVQPVPVDHCCRMLQGICGGSALDNECDLEQQLRIAVCARDNLNCCQSPLSVEVEIAGGPQRVVPGYAFEKEGQVSRVFAHQRISPIFKVTKHGCP